MNETQVRNRIMEAHNEVERRARAMFPEFRTAAPLTVRFFSTGRTAGAANSLGVVRYNTHIFAQDMERFIGDTVPHEIAHAVCLYLKIDNGHGRNWKRVCRMLGGSGERCYSAENISHNMARRVTKYEYVGSCGTSVWLSTIMHGKIQRGTRGPCQITRTRGRITRESFTGKTKTE